jgi:hypothetical protein
MMRNILLFVVSMSLISCDPTMHDDFILVNNCNENITISVIFYDNRTLDSLVKPKDKYTLFSDEWVGVKTSPKIIKSTFKTILVTKDNVLSEIDYINPDRWEFETKGKYYSIWFLTINPEDFETK